MADDKLRTFPCKDCGANLKFNPGASTLTCPYCNASNEIAKSDKKVEELDFKSFLDKAVQEKETEEHIAINCSMCAAQITMEPNVASSECPFCGAPIVAKSKPVKGIKPESLLPFKTTKNEAISNFKKWIKKLWFAPNKVKQYARVEKINGVYSPYWTYDCNTTTPYSGERGTYYYETESYTDNEGNRKTRQVQKTRWTPAMGCVRNEFDDVLVVASKSIPKKIADKLLPWDLSQLVPYSEDYLSGFRVESYNIDLKEGFVDAQEKMDPEIENSIKADIGGDIQRISYKNISYKNITFKHLLLPLWISAFRFNKKVYRFLVNARTGKVQGERPWSWIKITLAVLGGAAIIAGIIFLVMYFGNQ